MNIVKTVSANCGGTSEIIEITKFMSIFFNNGLIITDQLSINELTEQIKDYGNIYGWSLSCQMRSEEIVGYLKTFIIEKNINFVSVYVSNQIKDAIAEVTDELKIDGYIVCQSPNK